MSVIINPQQMGVAADKLDLNGLHDTTGHLDADLTRQRHLGAPVNHLSTIKPHF